MNSFSRTLAAGIALTVAGTATVSHAALHPTPHSETSQPEITAEERAAGTYVRRDKSGYHSVTPYFIYVCLPNDLQVVAPVEVKIPLALQNAERYGAARMNVGRIVATHVFNHLNNMVANPHTQEIVLQGKADSVLQGRIAATSGHLISQLRAPFHVRLNDQIITATGCGNIGSLEAFNRARDLYLSVLNSANAEAETAAKVGKGATSARQGLHETSYAPK